jgi:hypothetical protein
MWLGGERPVLVLGADERTYFLVAANLPLASLLIIRQVFYYQTRYKKDQKKSGLFCMVRTRGLEPPQPYGHYHLKVARLPIPPRPHEITLLSYDFLAKNSIAKCGSPLLNKSYDSIAGFLCRKAYTLYMMYPAKLAIPMAKHICPMAFNGSEGDMWSNFVAADPSLSAVSPPSSIRNPYKKNETYITNV